MPNIELHGYGEKAEDLRQAIDKAMRGIGLQVEAITNTCNYSDPRSCNGKRTPMPFLRIYCSSGDKTTKILEALAKAGICEDTEIIRVEKFLIADEMRAMA